MKDISCDVIRDLIPLYIDDICSEQSKRLIEDHIDECENCRKALDKSRKMWYTSKNQTSALDMHSERAIPLS